MNHHLHRAALSILWTAAALISVLFWYTLGEGFSGMIMALMALGLELAKVVLWSRWHQDKEIAPLAFAIVLTGLSLMATLGLTVDMLETRQLEETSFLQDTSDWELAIQTIEADRSALVQERDRLPIGWVTSRLRLTEALAVLDARKVALWAKKPSREVQTGGVAFRTALANLLDTTPQVLVLVLSTILALTLETGIIALSSDSTGKANSVVMTPDPMDSDIRIVLKASYRGPGLPMRGRGQLEQELILPTGRLRRAHRKLIQMGYAYRKGRDLYPKVS